jgi:LacI family transcriptional regulator
MPMKSSSRTKSAPSRRSGVRDVARAAGVSVATVSRALNAPEQVKPLLRARVSAAVEKLRYVPHAGARALASARTWRIGALIPTIDNSIFAPVVMSMQRQFAVAGYALVMSVTEFDQSTEEQELKSLLASGLDGVVLTGAKRAASVYADLERMRIPYVLTSIYLPNAPHTTIGYDNENGGRLLARHLLQLGHSEIGMIAGPCAVNDRAALRKAGVQAEMARHRTALPEQRLIDRPFSLEDGRIGFRHLMANDPTLTAVICGNDVLALGALFEAQAMGLQCPHDVSIVGFDGLELGRHTMPGLTTVDVHSASMGTRTAETLLARIAGRETPRATRIDIDLVVRGSTAPPRWTSIRPRTKGNAA